jgi:hypothetical protein
MDYPKHDTKTPKRGLIPVVEIPVKRQRSSLQQASKKRPVQDNGSSPSTLALKPAPPSWAILAASLEQDRERVSDLLGCQKIMKEVGRSKHAAFASPFYRPVGELEKH